MDFSDALRMLKTGYRIHRKGWNGRGMWLALQVPDDHSKMTLPYIYMRTANGHLVPWLASQTDILANDWDVLQNMTADEAARKHMALDPDNE